MHIWGENIDLIGTKVVAFNLAELLFNSSVGVASALELKKLMFYSLRTSWIVFTSSSCKLS